MSRSRTASRASGASLLVVLAFLAGAPSSTIGADPASTGSRDWRLVDFPPASPGSLRAEASGETTAWVKWARSDDDDLVASYELFRGNTVVMRGRATSFSDSGLAPATTYCYGVRAVDQAGRASRVTDQSCVTTPDLTPPVTPATPTVTLVDPGTASVTWPATTDNVGVVAYDVQRSGRVVGTVAAPHFQEGGFRPGKTYCYAVRASDRAGNWSGLSPTACVTAPDVTPPTIPRPVATGRASALSLEWPPSSDEGGVAGYEVLRDGAVVATTKVPSALVPDLGAGRHCFSVRAFDVAGNRSEPAEACGVVPDTTPPSRPVVLEVVARGETSTWIRWAPSQDDVGVVGYEVVRDGRVVARVAGTESVEDGLRPYTAHCYLIRALDSAGNRSEDSAPSCAMTLDLTPPQAPALLSATPLSDRALRVTWAASQDNVGVTGYEILRGGAVVGRSTEPAFELRSLQPGREYCVEIRAFDAAGLRSPASPPGCARTPDLTPPSTPAAPRAVATSSTAVLVGWSPSEDDVGVAGYEVWRGDLLVVRATGTSAQDGGLSPSGEYCYRLRAFDAAGNLSERSEPVCARTSEPGSPAAPVDLEAASAGPRSVALRWKPSPDGGVVYSVFWEGDKRIGSTRFQTYRVDGLRPGERRCFQVAAVDAVGRSSPKTWPVCAAVPAASSATTPPP